MFDEKHLDGLSFHELRQGLDFVHERMNKIAEETDHDDPRIDRLLSVADLILRRMDEIVRTYSNDETGSIALWKKQMRDYYRHHDQYADAILEDDLLEDI